MLKNLDFHGVKMAVTHFVTQLIHISRQFRVYSRKQKKSGLGKLFWKYGLRCIEKIAYVSTKLILEKVQKTGKNLKKKHKKKHLESLSDSGDKTSSSDRFLRPNFKTVFSKLFFCFLLLAPKFLETCVYCTTKCVTTKIYPMKV